MLNRVVSLYLASLLLGRLKRENRASSLVVLKQGDINFSISLTRREGNVHVLN